MMGSDDVREQFAIYGRSHSEILLRPSLYKS
jgi:hypothetical protein